MNNEARIEWLNARDPLNKWAVGDDVYCLHCDAVFKAEDVGEDTDGLPECPLCTATSLDFHTLPWWREDLVDETSGRALYKWRVPRIRATPGQPRELPPAPQDHRN
jgi:hypothetical protein